MNEKLIKRKEKLKNLIRFSEQKKKEIVDFVQKQVLDLRNLKISQQEYYERLKRGLKDKNVEEWIKYYDDYIDYYKYQLKLCERLISQEKKEKLSKKNVLILKIFIVIVLISILISLVFILKPVAKQVVRNIGEKTSSVFDFSKGNLRGEESLLTTYPSLDEEESVILEDGVEFSEETEQKQAIINKNVKWKKKISLDEVVDFKINLPKGAVNISVNTENFEVKEKKKVLGLFGNVRTEVSVRGNLKEYEVEYETPAVEISEKQVGNKKIVVVKGQEDVHYENILSFTEISEKLKKADENKIKIYKIVEQDGEIVRQRIDFSAYDSDENGYLDFVEWVVDGLSEAVYEIIIEIKSAEHLDKDKEFISDIYDDVSELDNNFSEKIYHNEYVRVGFKKYLDDTRDISFYVRNSENSNTIVEVYYYNSDDKIVESEVISDGLYKLYLRSMEGSYDYFDLKIKNLDGDDNAFIEFDYIVDPAIQISSCEELQQIGDSSLGTGTFGEMDDDYILINDIDCSMTNPADDGFEVGGTWDNEGLGFEPIGDYFTDGDYFSGTLEGAGYEIEGLYINRPSEQHIGLFDYLDGEIKNTGLVNVNIKGDYHVGGFVGTIFVGGKIQNCFVSGDVEGTSNVGGIAGSIIVGEIVNSYAIGNVVSSNVAGGLVGASSGSFITNSYAVSEVTGIWAGGLVGTSGSTNIITNSYWFDKNEGGDNAEWCISYSIFDSGPVDCAGEAGSESDFFDITYDVYNTVEPFWDFVDIWEERVGDYPVLQAWGDNYIGISSCEELQQIGDGVFGEMDSYYYLENNIDCSATNPADDKNEGSIWEEGNGFEPIGAYLSEFEGVFDGKGYEIDGLYINREDDDVALFGYSKGNIKNVGLTNFEVLGEGYLGIGGLVGIQKTGMIENCFVRGDVKGGNWVGGLVGVLSEAEVTNSYSTVIVSGDEVVGGLVGNMVSGEVINSYATGSVTGTNNVGGLVGYLGVDGAEVINSYWFDGGGNPSGCFGTGSGDCTLETDETKFYDITYDVYDSVEPFWDFVDIWEERVGDYPVLKNLDEEIFQIRLNVIEPVDLEVGQIVENGDNILPPIKVEVECLTGFCKEIDVSLALEGESYRKQIIIQGSEVDEDLTDFPFLIKLSDEALKYFDEGGHVGQINGEDIWFSDHLGNSINHELESYDKDTGDLLAWVKVPFVYSTTDTKIYINYGCKDCESQENPEGVWNNEYKAVWHMDDEDDSTQYDNDGTAYGGVSQIAGFIGSANNFDGLNDYIIVPHSPSLDITGNQITLEAWVKMPIPSDEDTPFIVKSEEINEESYMLGVDEIANPGRINHRVTTDVSGNSYEQWRYDTGSINDEEWTYVTAVYDGSGALPVLSSFVAYKNGVEVSANEAQGNILSITADLQMGKRSDGRYYEGIIDELRISDVARSAGWVEASFKTQSNPENFYNYVDGIDIVEEEIILNLISETTYDVPFYSIDSVIRTGELTEGESEEVVFDVSATGAVGIYEFKAYANMVYLLDVGDSSDFWNVEIIDNSGPILAIISPLIYPITIYENNFINFVVSANEALSLCEFNVDGGSWESMNLNPDLRRGVRLGFNVLNGEHDANFRCSDLSGNIGDIVSVHFRIEDVPIVNFIPPTPGDDSTTLDKHVEIKTYIESGSFNFFKYTWDGTEHNFYDDSLIFMMNFDEIEIGYDEQIVGVSNYENIGQWYGGQDVDSGWTFDNPTKSGKYGEALMFDGDGDYLDLGTGGILNVQDEITVSMWAKVTDGDSFELFSSESSDDYGIQIYSNKWHDNLEVWVNDNLAGELDEVLEDYYDLWTYYTFTYDSGVGANIYINGVLGNMINKIDRGDILGINRVHVLGAKSTKDSEFFEGLIDEPRIYNRVLTDDEIKQQYMSNLRKYDVDKWEFYTDQYKDVIGSGLVDLDLGTYTYQAEAKNIYDNSGEDSRTVHIVDSDSPVITYIQPIPNIDPFAGTVNPVEVIFTAEDVNGDLKLDSGIASFSKNGITRAGSCAPFIAISSCEDLQGIGGATGTLDDNYYLIKNIDCSMTNPADDENEGSIWEGGNGFEPIGYFAKDFFTGVFDGKGYEIDGLYVNRDTGNIGLFGYSKGIIKNVGLTNLRIRTDSSNIGGLVGYQESGIIENCFVSGGISSVVSLVRSGYGGLVGNMVSGEVINSYATGSVIGDVNVGGLVGFVSSSSEVINSYWFDGGGNPSGCLGTGSGDCTLETDETKFYDVSALGSSAVVHPVYTGTITWDFVDVWDDVNDETDYPVLRDINDPNSADFGCIIGMQYYDEPGEWNVMVEIYDDATNFARDTSETFNYNELLAFEFSLPPTLSVGCSISWTGIDISPSLNKLSNSPLSIYNWGNAYLKDVSVTVYDIPGLSYVDQFIRAKWFSFSLPEDNPCLGVDFLEDLGEGNTQTILGNFLDRGEGVSRDLKFCLQETNIDEGSLSDLQGYSTFRATPWDIDLSAVVAAIAIGFRRKKKKKQVLLKRQVQKQQVLLKKKTGILLKKYNLEVEDLLELEQKLKQRGTSLDEILSVAEREKRVEKDKQIKIPINIFENKLSPAEVLSKYLKENLGFRFRDIGELINRDERSIWINYNNANKKIKKKIKIARVSKRLLISIEMFSDRRLSVLESVVNYMKKSNFKNVEIAEILRKDQRNIATVYSRVKKKLR